MRALVVAAVVGKNSGLSRVIGWFISGVVIVMVDAKTLQLDCISKMIALPLPYSWKILSMKFGC